MRDQIVLLIGYMHGIWQYRWSALVITCVVAYVGWLVVYTLPNQYTAQAVLHVDTKSVMKPLLQGLSVESDVDAGFNIVSRILLSRKNLEEVIRQTDMDLQANDSNAMNKLVSALSSAIVLKIGSKRKNNNNIYELSYTGDTPQLSYQVVSKLLNSLIESTIDSARNDTEDAQLFLDQQISQYENRLTVAEQRLADFKRANIGYMPDETGGYYDRLQREQSELEKISSDLRLAKLKLSEIRKQLKGEVPLIDNASFGTPQVQKLRKYREQLEALLTGYTEQHPDVQALRVIIADTIANKNVEEEVLVDLGTGDDVEFNPVYQELKAELHRVIVEVETLKILLVERNSRVEKLKQSIDIIPEVEAKLVKLNRDYEITRERYLSMVERRESARLAQQVGLSGSNIKFRIIDAPRIPQKPSGPFRELLLSAVFLAAIAAGLGWAFLRYLIRPTYIDSTQIRNKVGLPILGSVGLFLTPEHLKKRRVQLTSFLVVFTLFVISFGGAVIFSASGSKFVNALVSSWSTMI